MLFDFWFQIFYCLLILFAWCPLSRWWFFLDFWLCTYTIKAAWYQITLFAKCYLFIDKSTCLWVRITIELNRKMMDNWVFRLILDKHNLILKRICVHAWNPYVDTVVIWRTCSQTLKSIFLNGHLWINKPIIILFNTKRLTMHRMRDYKLNIIFSFLSSFCCFLTCSSHFLTRSTFISRCPMMRPWLRADYQITSKRTFCIISSAFKSLESMMIVS